MNSKLPNWPKTAQMVSPKDFKRRILFSTCSLSACPSFFHESFIQGDHPYRTYTNFTWFMTLPLCWQFLQLSVGKGVSSKPSGKCIVVPNFCFWVRDFKFWLHAYFLILFTCAKLEKFLFSKFEGLVCLRWALISDKKILCNQTSTNLSLKLFHLYWIK